MRRVLLLAIATAIALAQPPASSWVPVRGSYQNRGGYGYRVTLPHGLVGYRAPAPAPGHGLAVELDSPANRIEIDGSYNSLEHVTPQAVLASTVAWISNKAASIEPPRYHPARLGGLSATEVVVRYREKQTGVMRLRRSIAAIRRSVPPGTMEIVYQIRLDTAAERTAKDTAVYSAILQSFLLASLT